MTRIYSILALWTFVIAILFTLESQAGSVQLKNGMRFVGTPIPLVGLNKRGVAANKNLPTRIYAFCKVDDGIRNVYLPKKQIEEMVHGAEPLSFEEFELPQIIKGRKAMFTTIGGFMKSTPFSKFGRKTVTVMGARGPEDIILGITKLNPRFVSVKGITREWEFSKITTSIPDETLHDMLFQAIDVNNPDDRMAVAIFFLEAGRYAQAQIELVGIANAFPEMKAQAESASLKLRQLQADQFLTELKLRKDSGQHRLAYQSLGRFPTRDVNAAVIAEVRSIRSEYDKALEQSEHIKMRLGELQSRISNQAITQNKVLMEKIAAWRSIVSNELTYDKIPRLTAFLQNEQDNTLTPEERLSLAYSGWIVGSANSITDIKQASNLWDARFEMLRFLKTENPNQRNAIYTALVRIEGIGPESVDHLLDYLSLPIFTPGAQSNERLSLTTRTDIQTAQYNVHLPPEYPTAEHTPDHKYPLLVVLHAAGLTPDHELDWWAGTKANPSYAQAHGYVVIAPEYNPGGDRRYQYSTKTHEIVFNAINDARKRFKIDSERIFIAGHGMGGDAVFDIAMSKPGFFAGAIPITGVTDSYCKFYKMNAPDLHWYLVGGELDRDWLDRNNSELNEMMKHGQDIICIEYKGRGRENYYEELPHIFEWMSRLSRPPLEKEIEVGVLRPSENEFSWFRVAGFPARVANGNSKKPFGLGIRYTPGNAIRLKAGTDSSTVLLSPRLVDFNRKLKLYVNGKLKFNDFPEKNIRTMLEEVRSTGERERRFWMTLTN